MFVRLVYESFRRQKRRKLLAGAAITLGVTVATAMIAVATDIGDKMNRELRTIGANLLITPQEDTLDVEIGGVNLKPPSDGAFLNEADLPKIKGTFWHNNITALPTCSAPRRSPKRKAASDEDPARRAVERGRAVAAAVDAGEDPVRRHQLCQPRPRTIMSPTIRNIRACSTARPIRWSARDSI